MLADRKESVFLTGDGDSCRGMGMDDTCQVGPGSVNGRMNHIARPIHAFVLLTLIDDSPIQIDLYEIGGAHFVEVEAIVIDEEMVFCARHLCRDVRGYQVRPA